MRDIIPPPKKNFQLPKVYQTPAQPPLPTKSPVFPENWIYDNTTRQTETTEVKKPPALKKKRHLVRKIFGWLFLLLFLATLVYGLFFLQKFYTLSKKITLAASNQPSFFETMKSIAKNDAKNLKAQDGRINILLLGIAGVGKAGQNLTDTVMLMSLDRQSRRTAFLSIPRDLLVAIPDSNAQMKINSVYQSGLSAYGKNRGQAAQLISDTVSEITGQPVDYYVVLDFDGFEKIIDSIGGINIISELDIYDTRYPGPNFSYETFELSKGFYHLDGATALKYVRERHSDFEGDFGRAKRQQQVMQAAKNKIFSIGTFLNPVRFNELLDALGNSLFTNIQPDEISAFIDLAKKTDTQNIINVVLDAWNRDSLLKVSHVVYGSIRAFVLVPRVASWSEVKDLAENIFNLDAIRQKRQKIAQENAKVLLINRSGETAIVVKILKILRENLDYKNVTLDEAVDNGTEEQTLAYDSTGGAMPFTLNEIATRLPAKVSDGGISLPDQNAPADIVVVIGKDLAERYNGEEGTMEDLDKASEEEYQNNN